STLQERFIKSMSASVLHMAQAPMPTNPADGKISSSFDIEEFLADFRKARFAMNKNKSFAGRIHDVCIRFIDSPQNRHKGVTSNMGELLVALCLDTSISLDKWFPLILSEILTRNVLWAVKQDPLLQTDRLSLCYRNTHMFRLCYTSWCLFGIFVRFHRLLHRAEEKKDATMSTPPTEESMLYCAAAEVKSCSSFVQWFKAIGMLMPIT